MREIVREGRREGGKQIRSNQRVLSEGGREGGRKGKIEGGDDRTLPYYMA